MPDNTIATNFEPGLVSVVIPTYNRADLIKETIYSVLEQTYDKFEIIVVDDGSSDNTKEVVRDIKDERIKYFYQENKGLPAAARNAGLRQSKGEFIAFLDSDDLWKPDKLQKQLNAFKKYPQLLLVATNGDFFPKFQVYHHINKNKWLSFEVLLKMNWIANSSILMKSQNISLFGYLDENPALRAIEDWDYWLRLSKSKKSSVLLLKERLFKYRVHETNTSGLTDETIIRKQYDRELIILKKHFAQDEKRLAFYSKKRQYLMNKSLFKVKLYSNQISLFKYLGNREIRLIDKLSALLIKYILKYRKRYL